MRRGLWPTAPQTYLLASIGVSIIVRRPVTTDAHRCPAPAGSVEAGSHCVVRACAWGALPEELFFFFFFWRNVPGRCVLQREHDSHTSSTGERRPLWVSILNLASVLEVELASCRTCRQPRLVRDHDDTTEQAFQLAPLWKSLKGLGTEDVHLADRKKNRPPPQKKTPKKTVKIWPWHPQASQPIFVQWSTGSVPPTCLSKVLPDGLFYPSHSTCPVGGVGAGIKSRRGLETVPLFINLLVQGRAG